MAYKNGTSLELFCIGLKRKAFDHIGRFSLLNLMLNDTLLPKLWCKNRCFGEKELRGINCSRGIYV
jgi:hypothetical protein